MSHSEPESSTSNSNLLCGHHCCNTNHTESSNEANRSNVKHNPNLQCAFYPKLYNSPTTLPCHVKNTQQQMTCSTINHSPWIYNPPDHPFLSMSPHMMLSMLRNDHSKLQADQNVLARSCDELKKDHDSALKKWKNKEKLIKQRQNEVAAKEAEQNERDEQNLLLKTHINHL